MPTPRAASLASRGTDYSTVDPEKTNSYEVGAKWSAWENKLSLGVALFRTEKSNARTAGVNPNDPPIVLDGKERVDGLEFNVAGALTREWEIFAGLALMESELAATNTAGATGNELGLTPKTTLNLWSTYHLPFGLTLGGGTQYMASVFRNSTSGETVPAYWLFSGMLAYPINEKFSIRLNATNLTDEEYIDRVGGGHHIPGQARQFILSANLSF